MGKQQKLFAVDVLRRHRFYVEAPTLREAKILGTAIFEGRAQADRIWQESEVEGMATIAGIYEDVPEEDDDEEA